MNGMMFATTVAATAVLDDVAACPGWATIKNVEAVTTTMIRARERRSRIDRIGFSHRHGNSALHKAVTE
jgi:hypothetical protein